MTRNIIEGYYDRRYKQRSDGRVTINRGRWPRNRFEALVRWAGDGDRVLDVGCGDGRVLYNLADRFDELHGTELSGQRLAQARHTLAEFTHKLSAEDIESGLHYEDNYFDCVISADVIEHLLDVRAALRQMVRVLRPEGRLVLATPNVASLKRRAILLLGRFPATSGPREGLETEPSDGLIDGGHLHYFTYGMLEHLLEQVGCTSIRFYGIGSYGRLRHLRPTLLSGSCVIVARRP